jgi:hypothetical protein
LIEVDVSGLDEVGKGVQVSDLPIPENVTVLTSEDETVVKLSEVQFVEEVVEEAEEAEEEAEAAAEGEGAGEETEGAAQEEIES